MIASSITNTFRDRLVALPVLALALVGLLVMPACARNSVTHRETISTETVYEDRTLVPISGETMLEVRLEQEEGWSVRVELVDTCVEQTTRGLRITNRVTREAHGVAGDLGLSFLLLGLGGLTWSSSKDASSEPGFDEETGRRTLSQRATLMSLGVGLGLASVGLMGHGFYRLSRAGASEEPDFTTKRERASDTQPCNRRPAARQPIVVTVEGSDAEVTATTDADGVARVDLSGLLGDRADSASQPARLTVRLPRRAVQQTLNVPPL